ncbi:HNH endonuclease family protein [Nocardioides sp. JQ2195]|uniref:HNH endonuclease family protein n=1 Tax=Nocardioides sp. JQ2195 TaxID=2592334 RepID=UPI0023F6CEDA|nr:HNH endonuclease family protein [Nocardioides sp. JQ2195]
MLGLVACILLVLDGVRLVRDNRDDHTSASTGEPTALPSAPSSSPSEILSGDPQPSALPSEPETQGSQATEPLSKPASNSRGAKLASLLGQVQVIPRRPNVDGYDRSCSPRAGCVFGTAWNDATSAPLGHNGCDTRNDVLRKDLSDIVIKPDTNGCLVLSGVLDDPYTGRTIRFQRGYETSLAVQIDHLIPLAAAWDLGAWKWSQSEREAFANDVTHELLAADGPSNMAKSDSTPASWLPPNKAFRCEYGVRYVEASIEWQLPVTAADVEVLKHLVPKC